MNEQSMKYPAAPAEAISLLSQSIMVGGRKYISLAEAASRYSYAKKSIVYMVSRHKLPSVRGKLNRIYVAQSALADLMRQKNSSTSKWQQMVSWWNADQRHQRSIRTYRDLINAMARNGIRISTGYARTFLALVRPTSPISYLVCQWIEADPNRLHLSHEETRRQFNAEMGSHATLRQVKRGRSRFYQRHGHSQVPDPEYWIQGKVAASEIGVSPGLINVWCDRAVIVHQTVMHKRYVLRSSLAAWLKNWKPRRKAHD